MNRIEKLIKEKCPDGVRYTKLGQISNLIRGRVISKNYVNEHSGCYPVYSSQTSNNGEFGRIDTYMFDGDYVTWTTDGAYAGTIFRRTGKFNITNICGLIDLNNECITTDFLYYWLSINTEKYVNRATDNPKLMSNVMETVEIPLPPLSIQQEIVEILDSFTALQQNLEDELKLRQKQYEHYREKLLTFEDGDVEWKKLGEVCIKYCSGSTPKKTNKEFYDGGNIPWLRTQDVKFNEIYEIDSFITEKAVEKTSVKWIPKNCVIVAISGATAGRCAINKIPTTTNQHCLNIEINKNIAHYKYVFFCVRNQYEELLSLKQGARGDLTSTLILNLQIPIPSLEKQSQIVQTLDHFESLISNLKTEIELRKKQYEYYREKLLTF